MIPKLKRLKKYLELIVSIFFILCVTRAQALPTDKEKMVHVVSDTADLSQQKHQGIYSGHVEFVQGTTNLHAAEALTQGNNQNKLTLAIARGNQEGQAHYWTLTDPNKPALHAYADTIKYYPLKHLIRLIGNARIEQGQNSMSAAEISYDTVEQHITSQSNKQLRTTIILYPEKKSS